MHAFTPAPMAARETRAAKSSMPGRGQAEQSRKLTAVRDLHRIVGNQAMLRRWQTEAAEPELTNSASPGLELDFSRIPAHRSAVGAMQTKLTVNEPGDAYEQEADRMAENVMRMSEPQPQRASPCDGGCHTVRSGQLGGSGECLQMQRVRADDMAVAAPPIVDQILRSPGRPLGPDTRAFMEPRFGYDFSRVRVHTGAAAEGSARDMNARAYTVGHDLVFGAGQFAPETQTGRRLIAHELTHVVQQGACGTQPLLLQRDLLKEGRGTETGEIPEMEAEPSAEDNARDVEFSEALQERIHEKFWAAQGRVARAQSLQRAEQRQTWIDAINSKAAQIDEIVSRKGPVSLMEIAPLEGFLANINAEVDAEEKLAGEIWDSTNDRYTNERIRLEDEGKYESELALKYLDQAFDEREPRISALIEIGALVQEDVSGLVHLLDNDLHIRTAKIVATRQRAEADAKLDRLSEIPEEGPGFLETAWSIVGCDSIGECLGDAALTVGTAGTGKALKFLIKAGKGVRKAGKARKIVRSAGKLKSTLHKLVKHAKAVGKFAELVKNAATDAAGTYAKWLKGDWKKILPKITTDWISNYTTGEGQGTTTVAVARVSKEFVAGLVENELKIDKANPGDLQYAALLVSGKNFKAAASVTRTYFIESLEYRTAVNFAFEALRATTPLTQADEILKRTVTSTIGEVAQDAVQSIPVIGDSSLLKYVTEAIRKVVQRTFG